MIDYERHLPPLLHHDHDLGVRVRTIIQGLILAGIVGLVTMVIQQGHESSQADRDRSVQIATLQSQVAALQNTLIGLPDLSSRVTRLEAIQADLLRRQANDDTHWDRLNNGKMKGWTR